MIHNNMKVQKSQEILAGLNPAQKEAVIFGSGPLLIVAGAGTGKTTVITRRIAYLIDQGLAKPEEILAVTFTEKAAEEMETRVDELLPYGYVDIWISTFHALGQRILKEHSLDIGLPGDFKLLNTTDQWILIRENLDKFSLDYYRPLGNPTKFIQALVQHFSRLKDELISSEEYLEYAENLKLDQGAALEEKDKGDKEAERILEVARAYQVYNRLLLKSNALDFGDLINYTLKLFQSRPSVLAEYQGRFKYILVDEFQDTNYAQYELVKLLAKPQDNLTVTGDDDQSIYKFRGASVSNILEFKKDYPNAHEVFITANYRSQQNILDISYEFIKLNNPERLEVKLGGKVSKKLKSQVGEKGMIKHLHLLDQEREVAAVTRKIIELKEKDRKLTWNDFAILTRTNELAEIFAAGLKEAGIPYIWAASRGLYKKPIIMDILAYFNLLDNYHESASFYRLLSLPIFKIKTQDLIELNYWASRKGISLYRAASQADLLNIAEESRGAIKKVLGLIQKHSQIAREGTIHNVFFAFMEDSGYLKFLAHKDDQETRDNIFYLNQLAKKIKQFETQTTTRARLSDFVRRIEMEQEAGDEGPLDLDLEAGPEAVKVMTIHKAKGLEFRYVFVAGLVDKRFPSINRRDPIQIPDSLVKEILPGGDVHLQEERRLFYVACTRAKEGLFFTSAQDYGGARRKKLSRFLVESGMEGKTEKEMPKISEGIISLTKKKEKVSLAETKAYKLPRHFSFTQLIAFRKCPLQYKFQFALRIPQKGHYQQSFGQTMHKVMSDLFKLIRRKGDTVQADLFGSNVGARFIAPTSEISWEYLKKIFENAWIDDWYPNEETQEKYRRKGLRELKEFYKLHKNKWPPVRDLEKYFRFKIGEDIVKGRIDRIDDLGGGEAELIDYKTGSARSQKTLEREARDQLLLYQLAAQEVLGLKPARLSFYYFENNEKISFIGTEKGLNNLKTRIQDTIQKIKSSDFSPRPNPYICKYCDFKEICEYRKL